MDEHCSEPSRSGLLRHEEDRARDDLRTPSQLGDRIWIDVDGFEFDDLPTCRMQSARVIAWARDLLSAQLEAHRVAPGGNIGSCIGLLQEELEEEMKGKAED